MSGHTYLCKSRHGVYYFRAVLPQRVSARGERREVRVSLRTKDRATAKILVAQKAFLMTKNFQHHEPWELDSEDRLERYRRGLVLLAQYGEIDLNDPFAVDGLTDCLTAEDFKDYLFALDHKTALAMAPALPPASPSSPAPAASASGTAAAHPATKTEFPPQSPASPAASSPNTAFDEAIDKAIERFVESKARSTTQATADKYGAQCKLFLKIVGDGRPGLKISDLTPKDIRDYVDTLPRLPTRIDSGDVRSLAEILTSSGPTLSAKTSFSHAQATNMFLTWCEAQQYPLRFNFHSILKPLLKKPRIKSKKKAFTPQQLTTLFEAEPYVAGTFKRASDYWVPLLGLFTGAREAELCQLEANDVRQDAATALWLLDINAEADKKLKTDSSAREVPLHPTLIDLGFLEFVESIRAANGTRLFADDERNKRGEFAGFSKRFNRYKEALGIKSDAHNKLDFHSFRHTLQTMLFDAGEEEYVVNALCGHSPAQQSEGVRTYSRGAGLKAKYELILKLTFPIDFSKIKQNGWASRA
ncbi:site-specific integrase [uncultured Hyphomicrobium sp.]|uniref:site-specific integrase n=1 Tax=uncultured Hyphomicrobium sp. TaxID=194373 RepID=UPI0025F5B274|nr:site-specific integrase [uncultured Hyphomicrobium sp.]